LIVKQPLNILVLQEMLRLSYMEEPLLRNSKNGLKEPQVVMIDI